MQPDNLKLTKKRKATARVKMLIQAHLYWLKGYPINDNGVIWFCPHITGAGNKIKLTASMISKAHRVINEMQRDYPLALPEVVGDATVWVSRSLQYLEYCKIMVQANNNALIFSLFEKDKKYKQKHCHLTSTNHSINNLIQALSWSYFIDRDTLNPAIQCIKKYEADIACSDYDILFLSQLVLLYSQELKKTHCLFQLYFCPSDLNVMTQNDKPYVSSFTKLRLMDERRKEFAQPSLRTNDNSHRLKSFVPWLLELNDAQRRRSLELINPIQLEIILQKWSVWWKQVDSLIDKIKALYLYAGDDKQEQYYCLQYDLKLCLTHQPEQLSVKKIHSSLKELKAYDNVVKSMVKLFKHLSIKDQSMPSNALFLIHWYECFLEIEKNTTHFCHFLNAFSKYIRQASKPDDLSPWLTLTKYYWSTCDYEILETLHPSKLSNFFETLAKINQHPSITASQDDIDILVLVVNAGFSIQRSTDLSIYLMQQKKYDDASRIVLKIIYELDESNENALKLINIWNKMDEEFSDDDTLELIYNTFKKIGEKESFHRTLFSEPISKLLHMSYQIKCIQKMVGLKAVPKCPEISERSDAWMTQYPDLFQLDLSHLASICDKAEVKIHKLFYASWWPACFIENEIIKIKQQIQATQNKKPINESILNQQLLRLSKLEKNLINHKPISSNTQEKIQTKIKAFIVTEQFNLWHSLVKEQFLKSWGDLFKCHSFDVPSWLQEDEMVRKLLPIIDFNTGTRELAIRVIKRRCTNQPWNFIDLIQNQQFLKSLTQNNVLADVWVDGIGEKLYETESGQTIHIDEAKDPLDMLNMGGYFKTCLSPGNFNYFSVFANIVDINKRVIYGKNERGKIIGRVLIGLLPSGGLTIFNIYYHQAKDEFEKHCLEYIELWAKKAGLILVSSGEPPTLVAHKWYDDGAISVDNEIECFKEHSEFRKQLLTVNPVKLSELLEKHLKPLKVNELTFSFLLQLPELKKQEALQPALFEIANSIERLSINSIQVLYKLSNESQYEDYCYKLYRKKLIKSLNSSLRDYWLDTELTMMMATNHPSDALNILKKLGHSGKNWKDCLDSDTAKVAIKALRALGRESQAKIINNKKMNEYLF